MIFRRRRHRRHLFHRRRRLFERRRLFARALRQHLRRRRQLVGCAHHLTGAGAQAERELANLPRERLADEERKADAGEHGDGAEEDHQRADAVVGRARLLVLLACDFEVAFLRGVQEFAHRVEFFARAAERHVDRGGAAFRRVGAAILDHLARQRNPLAARLFVSADHRLIRGGRGELAIALEAIVRLLQVLFVILDELFEQLRAGLGEDQRTLGHEQLLEIAIGLDERVERGQAHGEDIVDILLNRARADERGGRDDHDQRDHGREHDAQPLPDRAAIPPTRHSVILLAAILRRRTNAARGLLQTASVRT